jgi:hypothetical protein
MRLGGAVIHLEQAPKAARWLPHGMSLHKPLSCTDSLERLILHVECTPHPELCSDLQSSDSWKPANQAF